MKRVLLFLTIIPVAGGLWWCAPHARQPVPSSTAPDSSVPIGEPTPVPVPTLILDTDRLLREIETPIVVIVPTPIPTAAVRSSLLDKLSHFDVTVDEKRRPMLHYEFGKDKKRADQTEDK